jgi:S-DNA-T family DNA segregation ATPase FtsK/SpoIIIE
MRARLRGEDYAQLDNHDPFAPPAYRSPVYRTPEPVIWAVQLVRLAWHTARFIARHPLLDLTAAAVWFSWRLDSWPGPVILTGSTLIVLVALRVWRPEWFARLVSRPARNRWRWWRYRLRWHGVLMVAGLAPRVDGRLRIPILARVRAGRCTDRVLVGLVSGQAPEVFADKSVNLAHGFGVLSCRVRTGPPGSIVLELVRRDSLAQVIPAWPIPAVPDLRMLPAGRREDGGVLAIRLHGTHLLIAGATGSGKGSWLWGLIRAMLPAMAAGIVRVHACDPKLMELAYGRPIFERFGRYAADPDQIAALLEADVHAMQERAARMAGRQREHTPTPDDPFTVIVVDEVAFLTAYQADRKLKERTIAALATLTTQGRAVGYSVVAALQDPRKEVLNIRNLFPDKIALRLDEPSQADLVLGDGARDRGAVCDQISPDPQAGAGVGYIRLEADPDPVRVRAAFVSDTDIRQMVTDYVPPVPVAPADTAALTSGEAA